MSILVVTGPPAVGKTTVARLLADRREPSVHLHADDFWGFVANGYVDPWLPAAHEQNGVVIGAVCAAAVKFAEGGYDVVLDGVIGPWFVDLLVAAADAAAVAVDYVLLLPPLPVTLERLSGRTGHGFTSAEAATAMHQEFERTATQFSRHVLDNSELSPLATADLVTELLASPPGLRLSARPLA